VIKSADRVFFWRKKLLIILEMSVRLYVTILLRESWRGTGSAERCQALGDDPSEGILEGDWQF
jgi:hypothetical protein